MQLKQYSLSIGDQRCACTRCHDHHKLCGSLKSKEMSYKAEKILPNQDSLEQCNRHLYIDHTEQIFFTNDLCFVVKLSVHGSFFFFTGSRTSRPMIQRDINDSIGPDVDDEKPSPRGSDVQQTKCSIVNKQLSTEDNMIGNVHENIVYTNKDYNSVLRDKESCEGTIKSFSCTRCEMNFTSMEELTLNCETHKTAVEHQCHVCEKTFATVCSLAKHQQIHSENYHSSVMSVIKVSHGNMG